MSRECSGLAASWCVVHGDCTCVWPADLPHEDLDDDGPLMLDGEQLIWGGSLQRWVRPSCPLHGEGSEHG